MALQKDCNIRNSSRNLVFGLLLKIYQLLVPFIIRTVIIKVLGMEYVGLNSLFTSVLQVLNIAELGIGFALVYSMYKPIAEQDPKKICALMQLYKTYYRVIGLTILCIGFALTPFLPKLIKGDIPPGINIFVLYFLNLGATVLSYWLFAFKNALFQAHQRYDIVSKVTIITNTIMYLFQITLLVLMRNYYYYVIMIPVVQILNNILIAIQAERCYPEYKAGGKLEKSEVRKINSSIKDLFYSQLGLVVTTSVDAIVISAFLGLLPLAIYQNYYYILNALIAFFSIFYQSCRASIGTNMVSKSKEENYKDYKLITFVVMGSLAFCASCLMNLYQPFIEIWVGKENMLDGFCVALFAVYLCVYEMALMIGVYKDVSGKWHVDRFRPLLTAAANLVTNIILVQLIGIYGVLISTILSFVFINIPWLYKRVFIDVFKKEHKKDYTKYLAKKIVDVILIVVISTLICRIIKISSAEITLCLNFSICTLISVSLYCLFNKNDLAFSRLLGLAKNKINCSLRRFLL